MTIEDKLDDYEGLLDEYCGLAAAIDLSDASVLVNYMLAIQQHRGDSGVGILSSNHKNLHLQKGKGRVDEFFIKDFDHKKLPGKVAMGHNRYATRGSVDEICNVQPLLFKETKYGQFSIAHNGQLIDTRNIRKSLVNNGVIFQSTTDSETLGHLIAQSKEKTIEEAIVKEIAKVPTAYSLLIMTKDKLFALRDQFGVKPLSIAKKQDGYLIASETAAFRIFDDAEYVRDVKPGELVIFDKNTVRSGKGFESIQFAEPREHWCIFEGIYFSDPRSEYNGFMHEDFRQRCGMKVYEENKEFFDSLKDKYGDKLAVIPILDSGKQGTVGFCKEFGPELYKEYFMRRHNAPKSKGRAYTADNQKDRELIAKSKLDLRKEKVKDKSTVSGDDSVVRGTSAQRNNYRLRKAGAEYIVNVVLSPPITNTCKMGMDHQTLSELVAYRCGGDKEKIAKEIGADKIIYLSLEGVNQVNKETYNAGICSHCFDGKHPLK